MMKKSKIFGQLNNIKIQNKNMINKIFSSFWAMKQLQNSKQNMTKKKNKKNIKFSQKPKIPNRKYGQEEEEEEEELYVLDSTRLRRGRIIYFET